MNYKYLGIMFIVLIFTLSAVSAQSDINDSKVEIINDSNQSNENIDYKNTLNGGTFDDIQKAIDDAGEGYIIELTGTFTGTGNRITIDKDIIINGNQKTILDANKSSGFFTLQGQNKSIILNGLTFINSKSDDVAIDNIYGSSGDYKIMNCNFKNNYQIVIFYQNTFLEVTNSNFTNNYENYYLFSSENTAFKNCNFLNNTGGIYNAYSVENCNFTNNKLNNCELILNINLVSNCLFKGNTGYYTLIQEVKTVTNSKFISNTVVAYGLVANVLKVTKSNFENNYVKKDMNDLGGSGVVYDAKSVTESYFKNNKVDLDGGAINYVESVMNCNFDNNQASNGGAINWAKTVNNCNFNNNYAKYEGGAICDVDSVSNCNFIGNKVYGKIKNYFMGGGAAIYTSGNININKCVFKNNKATTSGSAIQIWTGIFSSKVVIKDSTFSNNVADGKFETVGYLFKNYGNGLIYVMGDKSFKITFKNCKGISKNTKNIFKLKSTITVSSKKKYLLIKVNEKPYNHPLNNLKVKIKVDGKTYKKTTDKNGKIKFSTKKFKTKKHTVKVTYAGDNFTQKSSKTVKIKFKR